MSNPTIDLLMRRRSVKPDLLAEPAPSPEELQTILTIASRVPDHKKLVPWRFVVIQGKARENLGRKLGELCKSEDKIEPSHMRIELEVGRFQRAPLVIAVVSSFKEKGGAPEWEQILSAGAACMNLTIAVNAFGYRSCWITEWMAYSKSFAKVFHLAPNEKIAGFIYIGTSKEQPTERERPRLSEIVSYWKDEGMSL